MQMTVITHHQATAVVHPAETAFNFPTLTVARSRADGATPLWLFALATLKGGNGRLDAAPTQLAPKICAVIGFVSHQFLRSCLRTSAFARNANRLQRRLSQREFMGLGTVHMQADRQTAAIDHRHHFRAFADLRLAYSIAPFLAGTKLPSKKACAHSSFPSASNWLRKARQIRSHLPSSDHSFNRRQQVLSEPYSPGRSSQAQPVFSTYRIPFKVRRLSLRGRPRFACFFGMSGSSTAHCSSLKSCLLIPPF